MQIKQILTFLAFTFCHYCLAQDVVEYKSWNPVGDEVSYIGGQAWQDELQNPYDRLPARAGKYSFGDTLPIDLLI